MRYGRHRLGKRLPKPTAATRGTGSFHGGKLTVNLGAVIIGNYSSREDNASNTGPSTGRCRRCCSHIIPAETYGAASRGAASFILLRALRRNAGRLGRRAGRLPRSGSLPDAGVDAVYRRVAGAQPVVLTIKDGTAEVGYFAGLIVVKAGLKILSYPFVGWTTPRIRLYSPVAERAPRNALPFRP